MSNYQLRMSTLTLTLFLATVCLEQYIEFMTLSISNISLSIWASLSISNITLYFEHHSLFRTSLSISNITLDFEHLSLFQISLSISNISLYLEHHSLFRTSLPISNITLYLEHHSLFRTSLALKHLSTSNIPKIIFLSRTSWTFSIFLSWSHIELKSQSLLHVKHSPILKNKSICILVKVRKRKVTIKRWRKL